MDPRQERQMVLLSQTRNGLIDQMAKSQDYGPYWLMAPKEKGYGYDFDPTFVEKRARSFNQDYQRRFSLRMAQIKDKEGIRYIGFKDNPVASRAINDPNFVQGIKEIDPKFAQQSLRFLGEMDSYELTYPELVDYVDRYLAQGKALPFTQDAAVALDLHMIFQTHNKLKRESRERFREEIIDSYEKVRDYVYKESEIYGGTYIQTPEENFASTVKGINRFYETTRSPYEAMLEPVVLSTSSSELRFRPPFSVSCYQAQMVQKLEEEMAYDSKIQLKDLSEAFYLSYYAKGDFCVSSPEVRKVKDVFDEFQDRGFMDGLGLEDRRKGMEGAFETVAKDYLKNARGLEVENPKRQEALAFNRKMAHWDMSKSYQFPKHDPSFAQKTLQHYDEIYEPWDYTDDAVEARNRLERGRQLEAKTEAQHGLDYSL